MNKKAIEGLPLKYVVIILTTALVISIVLEMMGVLKTGILHSVGVINETLNSSLASI